MNTAMKKVIFVLLAFVIFQSTVFSQCFPDRHSTNFFDGWISCEPATNPNPLRPVSHFIMYDFGKVYKLGQMKIWNTNDPSHLDWGMRDVAIDYSLDGENWDLAGEYTFGQASGLSTYEGEEGPDLNEIEARYLLITAINNYGGDCYGLSEFRVSGEEVEITDIAEVDNLPCVDVTIYPNPFAEKMTMVLKPGCNGELNYSLYDALGHLLRSDRSALSSGQEKKLELGKELIPGSYLLKIQFGDHAIQKNIIKMSKT
jgi:hypothetical protein